MTEELLRKELNEDLIKFVESFSIEQIIDLLGEIEVEGDFFYWFDNYNTLSENEFFIKYEKEKPFYIGFEFFSEVVPRLEHRLYEKLKED